MTEITARSAAAVRVVDGFPALSVNELILAFWKHVERHYRHPDGKPTSEVHNYKLSLRGVRELYGDTPARSFGPLSLKTVRQRMIESGWVRGQINGRIGRIRRMFKWGASEELIPVATYHGLTTVTGLQLGRSDAVENKPIKPVLDADINRTIPKLTRHVRGLVEFQRLTGCRPGEAVRVRMADIDARGAVWLYTPVAHKMSYRGQIRCVTIGPKGQALLKEFVTDNSTDFLFSPRKAVEEFRTARAANRKTPLYASHAARNSNVRVKKPKRVPAEAYTTISYRRAIVKACERIGVAPWHPNQIRHTFATRVREQYGLEAAQCMLGHTRADVTQVYAERNLGLAVRVAGEVG